MEASDIKRLKELEDENRRLKAMFAKLSLEHRILKDIVEKSCKVKPAIRRETNRVRSCLLTIITFCMSKLTENLCSYFGLQHVLGQFRVTNGVSRDSARMTKSKEKLYIRGQF